MDSLIRFHQHVVKIGNEECFKLPKDTSHTRQWCILPIDALNGAKWELPPELALKYSQLFESPDLLIGGPCFSWKNQYVPLFFKKAHIEKENTNEEEDSPLKISIVATQAHWDICPLVLSLIERQQLGIDGFELSNTLFSIAKSTQGSPDLSEILLTELQKRGWENPQIPIHQKKDPVWILFSPSTSPYSQNVLIDYEKLVESIQTFPENQGAIPILKNPKAITPKEKKRMPLYPFIPLNTEQQEAVSEALSGKPLSIVSGPPGCGKSQVVLSIILNAATHGEQVLFVSTNNNAVDVVANRFRDDFSDKLPFAVRTGSQNYFPDVQSILSKALYTIKNNNFHAFSSEHTKPIEKKISELKQKRTLLQNHLLSGIPERITQHLSAAEENFHLYESTNSTIKRRKEDLAREFKILNLENTQDISLVKSLCKETQVWIDEISQGKIRQSEDAKLRKKLTDNIRKKYKENYDSLIKLGIDYTDTNEWSWIHQLPDIAYLRNWKKSIVYFLKSKNSLFDLMSSYTETQLNQWTNPMSATLFKKLSTSTEQLLSDKKFFSDNTKLEETTSELEHEELPVEVLDISDQNLKIWNDLYKQYISGFSGLFSGLKKLWCKSKLSRQSVAIKNQLPTDILLELKKLDFDSAQKTLSQILKTVQSCKKRFRTYEEFESTQKSVSAAKKKITDIAQKAAFHPPIGWEQSLVSIFKSTLDAIQAVRELRELHAHWKKIGALSKIRELWDSTPCGRELSVTLDSLEKSPRTSSAIHLSQILKSNEFAMLDSTWERLYENGILIHEHNQVLQGIPSYSDRIDVWISHKPHGHPRTFATNLVWPDESSLTEELSKIKELSSKYEETAIANNVDTERADLILKEANKHIQEAIDELRPNIAPPLTQFQGLTNPNWNGIRRNFAMHGLQRVKSEIQKIDNELRKHSVELAKIYWLSRITPQDAQSLADFNISQFAKGSYAKSFSSILPCIPIWMTTAQSPQTLPFIHEMFDLIVIDEASCCSITNFLPILYRGKRICIIGDDKQLPPIYSISSTLEDSLLKTYSCKTKLLHRRSLFDLAQNIAVSLPIEIAKQVDLKEHFRSAPQIIGFSNMYVYQGKLLLNSPNMFGGDAGVFKVQAFGTAERGPRAHSWINRAEASAVIIKIKELREKTSEAIGVVTPFSAQSDLIKDLITRNQIDGVTVGTAHAFQGQQRPIVIFSPVAAQGIAEGSLLWIEENVNLLNVALTRAERELYVVGDFTYMSSIRTKTGRPSLLQRLSTYCENINNLRNGSLEELHLYGWLLSSSKIVKEVQAIKVQENILGMTVDFLLLTPGQKIVIEVDGIQHRLEPQKSIDDARDSTLIANGYDVIRISTTEARLAPAVAVKKIEKLLQP